MRVVILGMGSMGQRHKRNLKALRPDWEIEGWDRDASRSDTLGTYEGALNWADAAVIASPAEAHADQLIDCAQALMPVFVEKPLVGLDHIGRVEALAASPYSTSSAVGFCYRFHPVVMALADPRPATIFDSLEIEAWDTLVSKYGATVLETMTSHAVDIAIYLAGPVRRLISQCDGVAVKATLYHTSGRMTELMQRMDVGPRYSRLNEYSLYPYDDMYVDEMAAWVQLLEGGKRDPRLATLEQGVAVNRILRGIQRAAREEIVHVESED